MPAQRAAGPVLAHHGALCAHNSSLSSVLHLRNKCSYPSIRDDERQGEVQHTGGARGMHGAADVLVISGRLWAALNLSPPSRCPPRLPLLPVVDHAHCLPPIKLLCAAMLKKTPKKTRGGFSNLRCRFPKTKLHTCVRNYLTQDYNTMVFQRCICRSRMEPIRCK